MALSVDGRAGRACSSDRYVLAGVAVSFLSVPRSGLATTTEVASLCAKEVLARRIAKRGFAAHLRTACFEQQGEMKDTESLLGQRGRHVVLASGDVAEVSHGPYPSDF